MTKKIDFESLSDSDKVELICGKSLGSRFIECCGDAKAALYALENHPEWLYKIKGVKDTKMAKVKAAIKDFAAEKSCSELKSLGFSPDDASNIVKTMGSDASERAKENPYCLFFEAGISFENCDAIAIKEGFPLFCKARAICGLLGALRESIILGNTFMHRQDLIDKTVSILKRDNYIPNELFVSGVLDENIKNGRLVEKDDRIYTKLSYQRECDVRSLASETHPVCCFSIYFNSGSKILRFNAGYDSSNIDGKNKSRFLMLEILLAEMRGSREVTTGDLRNAIAIKKWLNASRPIRIQGTVSRVIYCSKSYFDSEKLFHFVFVKLSDGREVVVRGDFEKPLSVGDKIDVETRPCFSRDGIHDSYSLASDDIDTAKTKPLKTLKRDLSILDETDGF